MVGPFTQWLREELRVGQRTGAWEPPLLCSPAQAHLPSPPHGLHSAVSFLFPSKLETRSVFLERGGQYANSDEEDGYESPDIKRRGTSVDEFLKGSELGKPVSARRGAHGSATRVSGSPETAGCVRKVERSQAT